MARYEGRRAAKPNQPSPGAAAPREEQVSPAYVPPRREARVAPVSPSPAESAPPRRRSPQPAPRAEAPRTRAEAPRASAPAQPAKPVRTRTAPPREEQEEVLTPGQKFRRGLANLFTWLVVLAAVAMMVFTIFSVATFDQNDRSLFGYKAFIARSDSMSATDFSAGDLVILKETDPSLCQPGDIIAFRSSDPNSLGETFTHKIRERTTTQEGEEAFITYGTTTGVDDLYPVPYGQVLGRYQFSIPKVGTFFSFLKTVPGYICCILIPFLLLIGLQGVKTFRTFRAYRAEQVAELEEKRRQEMAELAAEREKLAAERAESQRLLAELRALQSRAGGTPPGGA